MSTVPGHGPKAADDRGATASRTPGAAVDRGNEVVDADLRWLAGTAENLFELAGKRFDRH